MLRQVHIEKIEYKRKDTEELSWLSRTEIRAQTKK